MIIKEKSGLNYEISIENLTAKVISSPFAKGDVFIPSFVNHNSQKYFITAICEDAFKNNQFIKTINFPEDSKVSSIGTDAFFGSSINTIYFPPSLKELKEGWCQYTTYLTKITVSSSNKIFLLYDNQMILGKSDPKTNDYDILYYAPRNIESVIIPSNIKYINPYAFANCFYLSTINFASNSKLKIIDKFSFLKASFEKIAIPDQVEIIRKGAFYKCSKLRSFDISPNSQLTLIEEDAFFDSQIERIFIPSKFECLKDGWCRNTKSLLDISISDENDRFSLFDSNMILSKSESNKDYFDVLCFASRSILSAKIPSTIKHISPFAFEYSSIQSIEFSEDSEIEIINKETFSYSQIKEVLFPKSVKVIGERTFWHCHFIQKVEFPENSELRIIESGAFLHSSIEALNIPAKFVEFRGSWCGFTQSLNKISVSPNNRRFGLLGEKIIIGKSETNDDDFDSIVFASRDIVNVSIPSKIKYINQYAFNSCNRLEKVEIGRNSKLDTIEYNAFSDSSIKSIYIPRHLTRIGRDAFSDSSLETIQFSRKSELQYIGKYAFSKSLIKSISIPDKVTTINDYAFSSCSCLESVNFSSKSELSLIGQNAFSSTKIKEMKIPDNVERICGCTFSNCTSLEKIEFTENSELRCIGVNAFSNSTISSLYIPSKVKHLKKGWCWSTQHLNKITVSPNNKYFIDIDGKMIVGKSSVKNENYDILYFIARDTGNVIIPSFIKQINSYSLDCINRMYSFKIEENSKLELIQENTFPFSIKLFDFDIPENIGNLKMLDSNYNLIKTDLYKKLKSKDSNITMIDDIIIDTKATEIYIPSTANCASKNAFESSFNLTNITVSPDNKWFKIIDGKMLVGKADIEDEKYSILYFAARDATNIKIPSYIKKINSYAFYQCEQLDTVEFESGSELEIICEYSFSKTGIETLFIPDHVQIIEEHAFYLCKHLTTITFSNESELKCIKPRAFIESSLTEITIPKNVECINNRTFSRCEKLTKVEFAEGSQLKSIKESAFELTGITELNLPIHFNEFCDGWSCSAEFLYSVTIPPENDNFKMLNDKIIIGKTNSYNDTYDAIYFVSRDIETVFIPSYIKQIKYGAFKNCNKIQKFEFEENSKLEIIGKKAFMQSSITKINIPESVKIIQSGAFRSAEIEEILIPSQITEIYEDTFHNSKIQKIEFASNSKLISIDSSAFFGSCIKNIIIPSNVQNIGFYAFYCCHDLKNISFECNSQLRSIENGAFIGSDIENILIPDKIEAVNNSIFSNTSLKSIEFGENSELTKITCYLFGSSLITDFHIPPKVTSIDKHSFCNAIDLTNITVSPDNKWFKIIDGKMLVGKANIEDEKYSILYFAARDVTNIEIPSYIKKINSYAFYRCEQLNTVEFESGSELEIICEYSFSKTGIETLFIPDHVQIIEEDAFDDCPYLNEVHFSKESELKIIGKYSFAHTSLNEITVPKSVKKICERAFSDCPYLEKVDFVEDSQLQSIGPFVFSNTPISSLFIPSKVNKLEKGWCRWTKKLETVIVSPHNQYYIDTDNGKYVFSKSDINSNDFDTLCFASRKIECVIVQPNIKRIDSYAFNDCCKIHSLKFDEDSKLESIEKESFSFSTIKYIDFPKSIKVIQSNAFLECKNIRSVNFVEDSKVDIKVNAFLNSSLSSLIFPKGCKEIVFNQFNITYYTYSIEFLGDDITVFDYSNSLMSVSLISFPNAKTIRISCCNRKFKVESIFVAPMANIKIYEDYTDTF